MQSLSRKPEEHSGNNHKIRLFSLIVYLTETATDWSHYRIQRVAQPVC